jgi:hypothetical protein
MKVLFGPECSTLARLTALRQHVVKLPEETLTAFPQLMYTLCDFPEQHATAGDEELTTLDIGRGRHSLPRPGLPPRVGRGSAHGPPERSDTIHEFNLDPSGNSSTPQFENRPKHMAQMARDYHEAIQEKGLPDEYDRILATEVVREKCKVHLSDNEYREMDKELTENDIREAFFLWDGKRARISDDAMYSSVKRRGKQVLSLSARNEAIDLWNLQSYLMQGPIRASWCYFVDLILARWLSEL